MKSGAKRTLWLLLVAGVLALSACDDGGGDGDGGGNNGEADLGGNNGADMGGNNGDNNGADMGDNNGADVPEDVCEPNPCLQPPAPRCDGDGVTLITSAAQGSCAEEDGMAICTYEETTMDCSAQSRVCMEGACVAPTAPAPAVGEVIITEIMYNPVGVSDEDGEYVEIYNTTDRAVGLDGCALADEDSMSSLQGLVLEPGAYATLGRNLDRGANGGLTHAGVFTFGLGNSGDTVRVLCGEDTIDEVSYDSQTGFPDATGASLNLNPAAYDAANNDLGANWCLSEVAYYTDPEDIEVFNAGTPGAANDACPERDVCDPNPCAQPPAASCDGDTLTTYGDAGTCADVDGVAQCSYEETVSNCADEGRVCRDGACILDLPQPQVGEVVITEIMYNPVGIEDEQGEWVELYHSGEARVTLSGCTLADDSGNMTTLPEIILEPGQRALLVRSADMELNGGLEADAVFDFGLNNGGDSAILMCGDAVIDMVSYDGGEVWPDSNGYSIALDPMARDASSNDAPEAWCLGQGAYWTGVDAQENDISVYGTPGEANPACPVVDVTVDACRLQAPVEAEVLAGSQMSVSGRVMEAGVTDLSDGVDAAEGFLAQAGYGPDGSDPAGNEAWTWVAATGSAEWSGQEAGYDEYEASFAAPSTGTYDHAFRFSRDGGQTWLYCDRDAGEGSDGSEDGYQVENAGALVTLDSPCDPNPCMMPPANTCADEFTLTSYAAQGVCSVNGVEAACDYPSQPVDCAATGESCVEGGCLLTVPRPIEGQVIITELMANPIALNDGDAEWVELHNLTQERLNLTGCTVGDSDPGNAEILPALFIEPGQYLLLGPNQDSATNGGLEIAATIGFGLNNGSGDVFYLECNNEIVDRVDFTDGAGFNVDNGLSLSLDPDAGYSSTSNDLPDSWCQGQAAYWTEAEGEMRSNYGSPGAANPACPDVCDPNPCTMPPAALCDGLELVTFPELGACTDVDGEASCAYAEVRTNCGDLDMICEEGACVEPPPGRAPASGEVVITEIMFDPDGELSEENAEWVEIHNVTQEPLLLNGCVFRDNDPTHMASLDGLVLPPLGYLVLGRSLDMALNGGIQVDAVFGFGLNNGGDGAEILCGETIIDEVAYDGAFPAQAAVALNLDPQAYELDNTDAVNWCLATEVYYNGQTPHLGTPGAANTTCLNVCDPNPCTAPPADYCEGDVVVVYDIIGVCTQENQEPVCEYETITVDCAADGLTCLNGDCVEAPSVPQVGDVIFNEIMYDTSAPLDEAQSEWMELYNTTDAALSLAGCSWADSNNNFEPLGDVSIPANGYLVFARSADPDLNGGITVAGTFSFALNNGGDTVTLRCGEQDIDVLAFIEGDGFPSAREASISLDPAVADHELNDDPAAWCLAVDVYLDITPPHLGTPGEPNPPCVAVE